MNSFADDPAVADTDAEFGAPEAVEYDLNAQINHALQSFAQQNVQAQWKIGQHAAEIDVLKLRLAEKESEVEALNTALQSEAQQAENLEFQLQTARDLNDHMEGLLERAGVYLPDVTTDPAQAERALRAAPTDAFHGLTEGQPHGQTDPAPEPAPAEQ